MSNPKVTVITPTHNRATLLKIAMQSVLECRYDNLQFIIVDDCSSDNTEEVVQSFQQKYPGTVTYIRNATNLRESGSINQGWAVAEGKYVVTLSDDDFFLPIWFDRAIPFMEENPNIIVGYPDWHKVNSKGDVVKTIIMPEYDFVRLFATCANMPGPGVIIRRSFLDDMKELREPTYIYSADYIMWIILATKAPFAHIPNITACWRIHEKSLTCATNIDYKVQEMELAINRCVEQYQQLPIIAKNSKKLIVRTYLHIVYALGRNNDFILAGKYALRAFLKSPYWVCMLAWCYMSRIVNAN